MKWNILLASVVLGLGLSTRASFRPAGPNARRQGCAVKRQKLCGKDGTAGAACKDPCAAKRLRL